MLTVHHLGKSQSERIVWLCEELAIPYDLKHYVRDAVTILAPPELKALHTLGTAPVITDGDVVLAESGAVMDYILAKYDNGRLVVAPADPAFPDYLFWLHFANGTLQPNMGRNMVLRRLNLAADHPVLLAMRGAVGQRAGHGRGTGGEGPVSRRQRVHGGRYHDGLLTDDDALLPAARLRALSEHSLLPAAYRSAARLPACNAEG